MQSWRQDSSNHNTKLLTCKERVANVFKLSCTSQRFNELAVSSSTQNPILNSLLHNLLTELQKNLMFIFLLYNPQLSINVEASWLPTKPQMRSVTHSTVTTPPKRNKQKQKSNYIKFTHKILVGILLPLGDWK